MRYVQMLRLLFFKTRRMGSVLSNPYNNFTIASNQLIYDKSIDVKCRFVYIWLASKPDGWEFYQKHMMDNMGINKRDTLRKYLKQLHDAGWITIAGQIKNEDGSWGANKYILHTSPIDRNLEPVTRLSETVAQKRGYPKKGQHSNTDLIDIESEAHAGKKIATSASVKAITDATFNDDLNETLKAKDVVSQRIEAEKPMAKAEKLAAWIKSEAGQEWIRSHQMIPRLARKKLSIDDYVDAAFQMYTHFIAKGDVQQIALDPLSLEIQGRLTKWVSSDLTVPMSVETQKQIDAVKKKYIKNDLDSVIRVVARVNASKDKTAVHIIVKHFTDTAKYESLVAENKVIDYFEYLLKSNKIEADLNALAKLKSKILASDANIY